MVDKWYNEIRVLKLKIAKNSETGVLSSCYNSGTLEGERLDLFTSSCRSLKFFIFRPNSNCALCCGIGIFLPL